jgi:hypothetical protein
MHQSKEKVGSIFEPTFLVFFIIVIVVGENDYLRRLVSLPSFIPKF